MRINKDTILRFAKDPKETGLYAVGHPYPNTTIKINGLMVGSIVPPFWNSKHDGWVIRIMVYEDDGKNWKWIQFKQQFETEPEARQFVIDKIDYILKKYKLHQREE